MLANTPLPPYHAVVFTSLRTPGDNGYGAMAERMLELAAQQPGYLGVESARGADGVGITVSYWDSEDAIARWKRESEHQLAQLQGRGQWYAEYAVRVARVERDYSHVAAAPPPGAIEAAEASPASRAAGETAHVEIEDFKRVFASRLDALGHLLSVAGKHVPDMDAAMAERLAPDMFPLGTQVAFACNQPRAFAHWSRGESTVNLDPDVTTLLRARELIAETRALVAAVDATDALLDQNKRTDPAPGIHIETSGRQFVTDFLLPNFHFHITIAYAILRMRGVPLGKADYMHFLLPLVRTRQTRPE